MVEGVVVGKGSECTQHVRGTTLPLRPGLPVVVMVQVIMVMVMVLVMVIVMVMVVWVVVVVKSWYRISSTCAAAYDRLGVSLVMLALLVEAMCTTHDPLMQHGVNAPSLI